MTGTFSFTSDDGEVHVVNYIADENGFRILPKVEFGDRAIDPNLLKTLVGPG